MPAYDPPLSPWPGIIILAIGCLLFIYLVTRIITEYRQNRALHNNDQTNPPVPETPDSNSNTNTPP